MGTIVATLGTVFLALIMIIAIRTAYLLLMVPRGRDIEEQIYKEIHDTMKRDGEPGETWQLSELRAQLNDKMRAEMGSAFKSPRNRIDWLNNHLLQVRTIVK